jgi:dipeptidyl aminopeptidase/acylaminoacyl peptidase
VVEMSGQADSALSIRLADRDPFSLHSKQYFDASTPEADLLEGTRSVLRELGLMLKRNRLGARSLAFIRWGIAIFPISLVISAQAKRPVTFDDLTKIVRIEQLRVSPDGRTLAYILEDQPDLIIVATKPGSIPRSIAKGTVPRWAPNNKRLAYYSRESGELQLWIFDVDAGTTQQITHLDGGIHPDHLTCCIGLEWHEPETYSWSPDSLKIVFHSQVPLPTSASNRVSRKTVPAAGDIAAGTPLILTGTTAPEWTLAGIYRVGGFLDPSHVYGKDKQLSAQDPTQITTDQLFIVDSYTKRVSQLTKDDRGYFSPDWSPDGNNIVCISNEGRELTGWGSGPTNVYEIDVKTGNARALTADSAYKNDVAWSPNGEWISYVGSTKTEVASAFVFVVSASGGTPTNATAKLDRKPFAPTYWTPDSTAIVVNYVDGVDVPIGRVDIKNSHVQVISDSAPARRYSVTVASTGTVVWDQRDPTCPSCIHVLQANEAVPYVLLDLNPQLKLLQLGAQEIIRWENGHGEQREGVLIKPTQYQPGRRYPLIVDTYPKQANGFKGSPMVPAQAWASRGYAVFFPNGDGPNAWENPWKSMASLKTGRGVAGISVAVDDVVSGTDELIRRGIVDPDRMCLYGFSNGGAIVNQVITRTTRFKCAISVAAAVSADWSSNFFLYSGAKFVTEIAGATPWEDPQAYMELSAVQHLDKVSTPLLLADGDDDGTGLLDNIEMYNGLRWLGKDVTLLRYPGQEHGFTGAAMKDFWERENIFLDSHLDPAK